MRQKSVTLLLGSVTAVLLVTLFLYAKIGQKGKDEKSAVSQQNLLRIMPEPSREDHILWEGSDDVVVVEYFDIDCRHCRDLLLKEDELPDSIKKNVRLIYRFFPLLDIFPHSLERAIIAECVSYASGDKAFFDFLRTVSRSYRESEERNDWMIAIAEKFVGNAVRLEECVSNKLSLEKINASRAGGYGAGIFSVPSFLVARKGMPVTKFDLLGPISGSQLLKAFADSKGR